MKRLYIKIRDYIQHDIPYGINNLIKWFPVIWKNRDWDHYFIYVILRHKLHLTEEHIRVCNNHTTAQQTAKKIKICVNLLDRLISDEYHEMVFKKHDEKWGEPEFNFKDYNEDSLEATIVHKNVKTVKDKEKERKDFNTSYEHEQYLIKQDKEMLFKIMNKYIDGWWD